MAGPLNPEEPHLTHILGMYEPKNEMWYADNGLPLAPTSSKISVPRQRGRFTQPMLLPRGLAPYTSLI